MGELLAHAAAEFRLDLTQEGGCSLRQQLEQVQAATGRLPAELRTPECPVSLACLLGRFQELASVRTGGFSSPQAIGCGEMQTWAARTDVPLSSLEARLLRLLDAAWIRGWGGAQPRGGNSAKA